MNRPRDLSLIVYDDEIKIKESASSSRERKSSDLIHEEEQYGDNYGNERELKLWIQT